MRRIALLVACLALPACGAATSPTDDLATVSDAAAAPPADPNAEAERAARLREAVDVWRLDASALQAAAPPADEGESPARRRGFERLDDERVRFLRAPKPEPCVDGSCGLPFCATGELAIEDALEDERPTVRLLALTILVRVRAPTSVAAQWRTLASLRDLADPPGVRPLLAELERAFSPEEIERSLARPAPTSNADEDRDVLLEWSIRAAGVRRHAHALDRLAELSLAENVSVAWAAVQSLAELPGKAAVNALVRCLEARGDAVHAAAAALRQRAPKRLERALLSPHFDDGWWHHKGRWLAKLGNPRAVQLLCKAVAGPRKFKFSYAECFRGIADLARPEDLALVEALPAQVPEHYRDDARATVASVRRRLAGR